MSPPAYFSQVTTSKLPAAPALQGWELGILGGSGVPPMVPGTRRRLVLPPELARYVRRSPRAGPDGEGV